VDFNSLLVLALLEAVDVAGDVWHIPSPAAELLHLALDVGLGWSAVR
jgi:hypothetical protein